MSPTLILGTGMTGLAAGWASGLPVYEAREEPGGICSSYYVRPGEKERLPNPPEDDEVYRFEIGGGHWIFGGDPLVLRFIRTLTPVKRYQRKSAVYFPERNLFVPYPLQHHLGYLGKEIAAQALAEMLTGPKKNPHTMADWLESSFGPTLTELFFGPFHDLYTAGLWRRIAPQDPYKTPVSPQLAIQGAFDRTPPVGYNVTFVYPVEGLNALAQKMAERCRIHYNKHMVAIDVKKKEVFFDDGTGERYETLISTLPLNKVMEMAGLEVDEPADPYTSVLVLNLGAERGPGCPDEHWLYIPRSKAGFHRVGFYSNVDVSFLPRSAREQNNRVSIYVERAYLGGEKPSEAEIAQYVENVIAELQSWGWIGEVEVADPTWIEVAYTWSWPGSRWREKALRLLEEHDILQVGRYGCWKFQGIADSISQGLVAGGVHKWVA
ncbi:protoporphyrinogen/coproporphyrinogen oxidase [Thermanaerothrix sp.]|uniref:protoporphyrinogen/coproporphyrinogen oxidase n=1 Tax=Thermanaerothrix sp. TaxID=2972675 RepID=UPI003C79CA08